MFIIVYTRLLDFGVLQIGDHYLIMTMHNTVRSIRTSPAAVESLDISVHVVNALD